MAIRIAEVVIVITKHCERRAGAVKDYLTKKGVNQALMQAIGHGETQPIADNSTNTGRAKNRRITFKIKN